MNKNIPILIDFDGIIRLATSPASDAKQFLKFLSDKKIPSYIISNSTLKTSDDIKNFLKENEMDFGIPAMTSVDAAINYVKNHYKNVSVFCDENIKKNFSEFIDDNNPEAVVIGDMGDRWNYETLNRIFRIVYNGADLIAMQKNKFWKPDGVNLSLDAGAFISSIEYATGKESVLIGKPSPIYFYSALELLGFNKDESFIMIGDDIETDIQGAKELGGTGILVYTGKTKYPLDPSIKIKPDYEAQNLKNVIRIIENLQGLDK
ncbi:MAG: HAD-IIA family hydrolase [Ignavibacteriaceae bacterium]|jgi:HAD superfamily hydrolase (TIGR01458 family)